MNKRIIPGVWIADMNNLIIFFLIIVVIGIGILPASADPQMSCQGFADFPTPVQVALSDNCSRVFTGSPSSGIVSLFDEKNNLLWAFRTNETVSDVAISPDGQHLYAATINGNVYSFDNQGTHLWTFRKAGCSPQVVSSPSGSGGLIFNKDDPENREYYNFHLFSQDGNMIDEKNDPSIIAAEISGNGEYVVMSTGKKSQTLSLYTNSSYRDLISPMAGYNLHTAISADARTIAVANPGDLNVYNREGDRIFTRHSEYYINSVATSPDGDTVILGTQYDISAFARNGTLLWNSVTDGNVMAVASSMQGNTTVAVTGYQELPDLPTSKIWRFSASGNQAWKTPVHDHIGSLAISRNAECIVAGSFNDTVYFLSDTGEPRPIKLGSVPNRTLPTEIPSTLGYYHYTPDHSPSAPGSTFIPLAAMPAEVTAVALGICCFMGAISRRVRGR